MNEIIAIFSGTRVGRNSIRPTNDHDNGRTNRKIDKIFIFRVGAYCIRPANDHANGRTNGKMDGVFIVRVGAYCIRPTNGHANGQMNGKMDVVLACFYPGNQKSDRNWIHSTTGVAVCRAYAIRPYPDGRKPGRVLVPFYPGNQKSDRN